MDRKSLMVLKIGSKSCMEPVIYIVSKYLYKLLTTEGNFTVENMVHTTINQVIKELIPGTSCYNAPRRM